jgi:hypothetical protein
VRGGLRSYMPANEGKPLKGEGLFQGREREKNPSVQIIKNTCLSYLTKPFD